MDDTLRLRQMNKNLARKLERALRALTAREWPLTTASIPWETCRFGWEPKAGSATKITFLSGSVIKHGFTTLDTVDTDITIAASGSTYVGISANWNLAAVVPVGQATVPAHTSTYYRRWFYRFVLTGGMATLAQWNGLPGNIDLSTEYAV